MRICIHIAGTLTVSLGWGSTLRTGFRRYFYCLLAGLVPFGLKTYGVRLLLLAIGIYIFFFCDIYRLSIYLTSLAFRGSTM